MFGKATHRQDRVGGRAFAGALALAVTVAAGCTPVAQRPSGTGGQGPAEVTFVHLNDIYEILPVEGGKAGGPARVATVVQQTKKAGVPVVTTLGGDYLSPSAIGTAIVDGQPLAGRQVVDVLNAVGLDWATFGNHEFDVSEAAFRAHLAQAKFRIVSSNVTDAAGRPFPGVPTSAVVPLESRGRTVRIGLIGITIDANARPWVRYRDGIAAAKEEVAKLRGQVDAIVALTHLSLEQDAELVTAVPGIDLVLGGHEHENWLVYRGPFVPIVKADANVRSLAFVTLVFGAPGARPGISPRLEPIDDTIASDPAVDAVAKGWVERAFVGFSQQGFAPAALVAVSTEPLDGREATVRNREGRLTDLVATGIAREGGNVEVAFFNSGSIRIDDVLPPGPITEYDVIRVMPFGGRILRAQFDGELLVRVLDTGVNNEGTGGFLQTWGARRESGAWLVQGKPVDPKRRYAVALIDFLLTGREKNLGFLTRSNPQVHDVIELRDVRRVVIEELARVYPPGKEPR